MRLDEVTVLKDPEVEELKETWKSLKRKLNKINIQLNEMDFSSPQNVAPMPGVVAGAGEHHDALINKMFQETIFRMEAAKKGLGLANKLRGSTKKNHLSRIMGNMNRIRAQIRRMEQLIANQDKAGVDG